MKPEHEELSTADLARASEDVRGTGQENMTGSEAVVDRPAQVVADRLPTASSPKSAGEGDRTRWNAAESQRDARSALFPEKDAGDLRKRWSDIQTGFVDEPRRAVEQADALVADVMKRLAETFASERASLEGQWDRGDNVTTEDLRVALQRYRSFFDRLLAV